MRFLCCSAHLQRSFQRRFVFYGLGSTCQHWQRCCDLEHNGAPYTGAFHRHREQFQADASDIPTQPPSIFPWSQWNRSNEDSATAAKANKLSFAQKKTVPAAGPRRRLYHGIWTTSVRNHRGHWERCCANRRIVMLTDVVRQNVTSQCKHISANGFLPRELHSC